MGIKHLHHRRRTPPSLGGVVCCQSPRQPSASDIINDGAISVHVTATALGLKKEEQEKPVFALSQNKAPTPIAIVIFARRGSSAPAGRASLEGLATAARAGAGGQEQQLVDEFIILFFYFFSWVWVLVFFSFLQLYGCKARARFLRRALSCQGQGGRLSPTAQRSVRRDAGRSSVCKQ